jgi:hypothetical protein
VIVDAGDERVAALDAVNKSVLHQEVERAIDRDRRRTRAGFAREFDDLVGAERFVTGEQRLQHLAADRRQSLGTRFAECLCMRQGVCRAAVMIMVRRGKSG